MGFHGIVRTYFLSCNLKRCFGKLPSKLYLKMIEENDDLFKGGNSSGKKLRQCFTFSEPGIFYQSFTLAV